MAQEYAVDAVVSDQCDYARYAQAWLSDRLDLPGPSMEAVSVATNKKWMRRAMETAGVDQPDFDICKNYVEVEAAAERIGYPVILKPVDNRGSFGISRVDDSPDLHAAWLEAVAHAHSREIIVESYVDGEVITVDGAFVPGEGHRCLGVASKEQVPGSREIAMEIIYPGEFDEATRRRAEQAADKVASVLRDLGATGLTHTELLYDGTDFNLVEVANRGGGVHTSSCIAPTLTGFDTTGLLLAESAGTLSRSPKNHWTSPDIPKEERYLSVLLKFFELEPGTVASLGNFEAVLDTDGVLEGRIYIEPGDEIEPVATAVDRNGFLITAGETRKEARQVFDDAIDHLEIEYA